MINNLGNIDHVPMLCWYDLQHSDFIDHDLELKYNWFTNKPYLRCKRCHSKFKYISKSEKDKNV